MSKIIVTNLLGRTVKQNPRAPYAWWVREDKSVVGYTVLAARAKIVAVWTELETVGQSKGESVLKVAAEALDGEVKGEVMEMYARHFLLETE